MPSYLSKLSILIPTYNERRTVIPLLARVAGARLPPGMNREIVVVDDMSTDGTREALVELEGTWRERLAAETQRAELPPPAESTTLRVAYHEKNRGKAAALRTGIELMTGDFVIVQDADLEYDVRDYARMLEPLVNGDADVVYGSRFGGEPRRVLYFRHTIGNRALTMLSNLVTDLNLTDMETCYKAFRAELLRDLHLQSERFGFEPEVTCKVARMGWRVYEVPISYHGRSYAEGKKITWKDGVHALGVLFRHGVLSSQLVKKSVGTETLVKLRELPMFNQHLYETIRPWVGKRVLEVGSGEGNITQHLLAAADRLVVTDVDAAAVTRLQRKYAPLANVEVARWDLEQPAPASVAGAIDSIVCINVLEHVADDARALRNSSEALAPGGSLVLLVPAFPALYSPLDASIGHHRRYTRESLTKVVTENGFRLEQLFYFNFLGTFGWFLNGRVLGRDRLPMGQLKLYEAVASRVLPLERRWKIPFGLSLIAICRPERAAEASVESAESTDGWTKLAP